MEIIEVNIEYFFKKIYIKSIKYYFQKMKEEVLKRLKKYTLTVTQKYIAFMLVIF